MQVRFREELTLSKQKYRLTVERVSQVTEVKFVATENRQLPEGFLIHLLIAYQQAFP